MKKISSAALLLVLVLCLAGCGKNSKKELNHMLLEMADVDQTIDANDWATLEAYFDGQKANFRDFYKDGQLDVEEVKVYVNDFFGSRRPPKEIQFAVGKTALNVNFYLERSGSMVPYDAVGGDGSFKAAIVLIRISRYLSLRDFEKGKMRKSSPATSAFPPALPMTSPSIAKAGISYFCIYSPPNGST